MADFLCIFKTDKVSGNVHFLENYIPYSKKKSGISKCWYFALNNNDITKYASSLHQTRGPFCGLLVPCAKPEEHAVVSWYFAQTRGAYCGDVGMIMLIKVVIHLQASVPGIYRLAWLCSHK